MKEKTFQNIEQLKEAYSSQNREEYNEFVKYAEGFVEKTIVQGLKYDGRIIWDRFYSGYFNIEENSINFLHYLIDTKEYFSSKVMVENDASIRYVKINSSSNEKKKSDEILLKEIKEKIQSLASANEMMKLYLNMFFDNKKHIIKVLNFEDKSSNFKIFNNSVFEFIILNACKELINPDIKAVTFEYLSVVLYNFDDECIHMKFYYASEKENKYDSQQYLKLKLDTDLYELRFEISESDFF